MNPDKPKCRLINRHSLSVAFETNYHCPNSKESSIVDDVLYVFKGREPTMHLPCFDKIVILIICIYF